ncbi:MAG: enoyl-CoA hydratase/isomerase family protein [Rhizobiales bacterium]|nr:enoyl-CoA hydratase/isomerase family protein [Hyphomicrobiales bacterium]
MTTDELLIRVEGRAGRITLNRPHALNALNYAMVMEIERALHAWAGDPAVALVIIDGAGERAFCAGGDIEELYHSGRRHDFQFGLKFWRDEYRLNALIDEYPKPYIALMHGFVMGGGVGVSAHGSHRIVTETAQIAMPECSIGLIPDVGGTHLLGAAPGHLGEYIGLTGYRMGPADAIHAGFADVYVPEERRAALTAMLEETGDISQIADFSAEPPQGLLAEKETAINRAFSGETAEAIEVQLISSRDAWAEKALSSMKRASPLSLLATLRMIRAARARNNLRESLEHELRFTARAAEKGDLLEGIRAAIIDKDRRPEWRYPNLEDVPSGLVDQMLAPL